MLGGAHGTAESGLDHGDARAAATTVRAQESLGAWGGIELLARVLASDRREEQPTGDPATESASPPSEEEAAREVAEAAVGVLFLAAVDSEANSRRLLRARARLAIHCRTPTIQISEILWGFYSCQSKKNMDRK